MHRTAALLSLAVIASVSAFVLQPSTNGCANRSGIATRLSMSSALIVQNKGGGHGELGYQLAKTLSSHPKITSVTILQDDACKDTQEPFKSYASDLPDVTIIKAPLGSPDIDQAGLQSILGDGTTFDYVWDNASKAPEGAGKALCDCAKDWGVKLYTYVSSAGIYKPAADGPFPMREDGTTPIKATAGQALLDQYAVKLGLPLVSFRPQYIYGPKSNKFDYIDYYFDRLVRGLPIPIPGDGTQLVSLTNSQDVASLLAAPLDQQAAAVAQRYFNCGTDQLVSYDTVAHLCAAAVGVKDDLEVVTPTIEHYDGDLFGKGPFPFRLTNFFVSPDVAKNVLGWPGAQHSLADDLVWYYEEYKARGGPDKKMSFAKDWEIVVGHKTPPPDQVGSIYDKYDPIILDTSLMQ
jgi:nucleoside-diphosphate-sugar epimerase